MKNTIIVEAFINGANTIFNAFCDEIQYILIQKAINSLTIENNAMKELFTQTRNDLDINNFRNKALKNHKIDKEIKTEDLINMKNSILDDYHNNQIYPKEYKTDHDNELLNLIIDKIQDKYDPLINKDLDMQDLRDHSLEYWKFKNGDL